MISRCIDCHFFVYENDGCELDEGTCRRYPPSCDYNYKDEYAVSIWPHVNWGDWCGEFVPRREVSDG